MNMSPELSKEAAPAAGATDTGRKRTSGLAVASLVCSLIFFFPLVPLVGVILAIVSLSTNRGRMQGRGLAIAGLIVGLFLTIFLQGLMAAIAIPAIQKYVERAKAVEQTAIANTPVRSKDGWVEVTPPGDWSAMDNLNDSASTQLGNLVLEEYFVVISDNKVDYAGTLPEYGDLTSGAILGQLTNGNRSRPTALQINGRNVLQYEITGTLPNFTNVVYLDTIVDGESGFHQLLAWTVPSRKDAVFPKFQKVVSTFREIPGAVPKQKGGAISMPGAPAAAQSVTSSDGSVKLLVPGGFTPRTDLVDGAILQMGDLKNNTFLVLQAFQKTKGKTALEKFAEESSASVVGNLEKGTRSSPSKTKAGAFDAVEYRLDGTADQFKLIYHAAYIDGGNAAYELMMWTVPTNEASSLDVFHQITNTFEEVAPQGVAPQGVAPQGVAPQGGIVR